MERGASNVVELHGRDARSAERHDLMLSRRTRIRRTFELPHSLAHELATGLRYPLRMRSAPPGYEVHYRRDRWCDLAWNEVVYNRETFAWIFHSGERIGAVAYSEYRLSLWASDDEVFDALDGVSTEAARAADLLTLYWRDVSFRIGQFLVLEALWQSPRHRSPGAVLGIATRLLARPRRRASVLFADAFPDEYVCRSWDGSAAYVGRRRRQAAMIRTAERRLGLRPLPGKAGEIGWLYALGDDVTAPRQDGEPKTTLLW